MLHDVIHSTIYSSLLGICHTLWPIPLVCYENFYQLRVEVSCCFVVCGFFAGQPIAS